MAALAAQRAGKTDIEGLHDLLHKARTTIDADADQNTFLAVDREIHYSMAEISQNPIYICILKTIHDNIHQYFQRFLAMKKAKMLENYNDLVEIIHAVENGQADRARERTRMHVKQFNHYMLKQQQGMATRGVNSSDRLS